MKDAQRTYAICAISGAIVALVIWLVLDLPWLALGLGLLTALIVYANMSEPKPEEKEKQRELSIRELHPPS